ncbi:MAG: type III-B CRISPR module RAMP protein Cmr6 [Ignavibacteria bacterium]|nr:type III-B CRISPR module RAMP protein Cmr6 [Ignavibacteria bacterium]
MKTNLKLNFNRNRYRAKDTNYCLKQAEFSDNFYYYFNMPTIITQRNTIDKIRINDDLQEFNFDNDFVENISQRLDRVISNSGLQTYKFSASVSWRLVIGLGASHPQETSMTLHHIYGIPFIPGSAVKGVTRHWIIYNKFNQDEKNAEKDEKFIDIFGSQEQAGNIIFFDAFPIRKIKLQIDIMNPHYPDYYSNETAPADWQNPVPIKFLTIKNTQFLFILASKKNNKDYLQTARDWLKEALENFGVGAKTSIGYGYFNNIEDKL